MGHITKAWLLFLISLTIFFIMILGHGEASYNRSLGENFQLTLGGHIKSLNLARKKPLEDSYKGFTDTQVRLDLSLTLSNSIKTAYSQKADLLVGETNQISNSKSPFDLKNLDATPINEDNTVMRLRPDRLYLNWESGKLSTTIGRQAIGFGNLLGFSPLDLISPFPPLDLDKDVRPGVDGIKVEYYPESLSTITAVAVLPEKSEMQSYLLLYALMGEKGDLNLLLGCNQKKPALGLGYSQDVKGMGIRAESLFFGGKNHANNSGYAQAGIEVDYLFKNNLLQNDLYVDIEFYYNGNGEGEPEKYNLQDPLILFKGRYYALLNSSYELTPLFKLSLAAIANLQDESQFISPRFTYSISENSEVFAFINFALGRSPTLYGNGTQGLESGTIRSEYGSVSHGGGIFLRLFF